MLGPVTHPVLGAVLREVVGITAGVERGAVARRPKLLVWGNYVLAWDASVITWGQEPAEE